MRSRAIATGESLPTTVNTGADKIKHFLKIKNKQKWFPYLLSLFSMFSHSAVSNSLKLHGLQHARLPCPSLSPQSLLKIMSVESVMPSIHLILCQRLLLLPSIFPRIRVFSISQFFSSCGQSIGVSALASVLPMNIQDWFPLGWTGWISWQSKRL